MKYDFFNKITEIYNLGEQINSPIQMDGGITNKVYKIQTTKGKYIIKLLYTKKYEDIENSERICEIAKSNGINAIGAIKLNNKFVNEIDGKKLLVYPYYDGKILKTKEITINQVKIIAAELAKLHSIDVESTISKLINKDVKKYSKIDFVKYYNLLANSSEPCYALLKENIDKLVKIYEKVYIAYSKLSNQISYIHRDYNRKNILWKNNDELAIIDWETATVGNPSIDFFKSSWFMTADVEENKFLAFKEEYFKTMELKDDAETGALAGLIEECNWLEFSLKRALKIGNAITLEEMLLGRESIASSVTEILNYYDKIELMMKFINVN